MAESRRKRVTITIDSKGSTVQRIKLLTDSLLRVVQGSRLILVEDADYIGGCIVLVIEGSAHCDVVDASVHVEVEPVRSG